MRHLADWAPDYVKKRWERAENRRMVPPDADRTPIQNGGQRRTLSGQRRTTADNGALRNGTRPDPTERNGIKTGPVGVAGQFDQILVSQDVAWKVILRSYGGQGYGHILRNIVPRMQAKGMTEEQIHAILVANPRKVNTFV